MENWGMRLRVAALATASALALAACGGDGDDDQDADDPASSSDTASTDATTEATEATETAGSTPAGEPTESSPPPSADDIELELVDPGEGPGRVLTLDLLQGDESNTTMSMTTTSYTNGQVLLELPMEIDIHTEVTQASPELNTIRTTFTRIDLDSADLPAEVVDQVKAELDPVKGLAIVNGVDASGAILSTEYSIAGTAPPTARQLVEQFATIGTVSVAYPTEPIGVGAVWTITQRVDSGIVPVDQVTTYTLEELDDGNIRLGVGIDGMIEPSISGGAPEGTVSGEGEINTSLQYYSPTSSTATTTSSVTIEAGGQQVSSRAVVEVEVTTDQD